ncbi:hypothetical protein CD006_05605 [Enterobacter sp. 10-1]|jgi:hypothetical protein|nr:hypothetical protein CD006_05605 [Enterobacter sp. 10-1]
MYSLRKQLSRYSARYTLLTESQSIHFPWEIFRNTLIMHQCAAIELCLAERGWTLHVCHDETTGFLMYIARSKYGRQIIIRYPDYQREMAKIR